MFAEWGTSKDAEVSSPNHRRRMATREEQPISLISTKDEVRQAKEVSLCNATSTEICPDHQSDNHPVDNSSHQINSFPLDDFRMMTKQCLSTDNYSSLSGSWTNRFQAKIRSLGRTTTTTTTGDDTKHVLERT